MRPAALGLLLGLLLGWLANGWRLGEQIAEIRADHAEVVAAEQQRSRKIEQGWHAAFTQVQRNAHEQRETFDTDKRAADAESKRLRDEIETLARRPAACPSAASGGSSADPARVLLAELLSRIDEVAGGVAAHADRARVAGTACEAAYDSLSARHSSAN